MPELLINVESGIYTASGIQIFKRLIEFFSDMLNNLIGNDFFIIIIGVFCVILALNLLKMIRKTLA